MLRQELQSHLDKVYPFSKIDTEHTLCGKVTIRFELGDDFDNGSSERVNQATERALTIFNEIFEGSNDTLWVLIYEYQGEDIFTGSNEYLYQQFQTEKFKHFYNELELVNSSHFLEDQNGNEVFEKIKAKIIIGKLEKNEIKIKDIFCGIANREMGLEPIINQSIYFLTASAEKGFHMYDDRGCFIWSDIPGKIKDIYVRRNDWISDYTREDVDEFFK